MLGRDEEKKMIQDVFNKFLEIQKQERKAIEKLEDTKSKGNGQYKRKGSISLLNRSISFNSGAISGFSHAEVPRLLIEGDGGLGKSSLLRYIRDISAQEKFSVWLAFFPFYPF